MPHHSSRTRTKLKEDPDQAIQGDSSTVLPGFWSHMGIQPQQLSRMSVWKFEEAFSKKMADRKVNTTPIQDRNHFWESQEHFMV